MGEWIMKYIIEDREDVPTWVHFTVLYGILTLVILGFVLWNWLRP